MSDASLIVPGLIHVGGHEGQDGGALVQVGAAVGWTMPKGIHTWRRELSIVLKDDLSPELCSSLGVVLPEAQGDEQSVPRARKAAQVCNLVAVEGEVVGKLVAKGIRVHTVGFDSVSNGFFYISKGGTAPARSIQAALIEMIAPSLTDGTNQEIASFLDGLIDRFVSELTDGVLTEAQLELADALPALGPKDRAGAAKLQELEGWLILVSTRSAKHEGEARKLVETLRSATMRGTETTPIPILGEAHRVSQTEIMVEFIEGDAGQKGHLTLPSRSRWFVSGKPAASVLPAQAMGAPAATPKPSAAKETPRQPAVRPVVPQAPPGAQPAAQADAAAAAERAAAERAAAQRAAAERAAAERASAERAASERQAAERAAAERAASERAAAERAAAERAAAERAASERAASERAAAERAAAEQATLQRAAAERAAAEKEASDRAAAELAQAAQRPVEKPKAAAAAPKAAEPDESAPKEGGFPIDVVVLVLVLIAVIVVVVRRYVLPH